MLLHALVVCSGVFDRASAYLGMAEGNRRDACLVCPLRSLTVTNDDRDIELSGSWTAEDDAALRQAAADHAAGRPRSVRAVSALRGRSQKAINERCAFLGLAGLPKK